MANHSLSVVHISPCVQGAGGIETLLRHYARWSLPQTFVALFDRAPQPRPGYINLNFTWRDTIATMRRKFAEALQPHAGSIVIYHNGWGLPFFADLDHAVRRLVFLHADPAYHRPDLPGFRGRIDGVEGLIPALEEMWRSGLPEMTPERGVMAGLPVEPIEANARPFPNRPLVLGYAGRLEKNQKRLDRLRPFLDALDARGVKYSFEVLGVGSYRPTLERELGHCVHFHGYVDREKFRQALANWDGVVYFSDNEGGPLALLEAMAAGAIPFYPAHGGSWGDIHAPRVDPLCHYPAGNVEAAANAVATIFARPDEELIRLRKLSQSLVQIHVGTAHGTETEALVRRVAALPRISATPLRGARLTDWLPLGYVTRFAPGLLRK